MSDCAGLPLAATDPMSAPEFAFELQQQAFGCFFANAGYLGQANAILQGHGLRQLGHAQTGQHRQRHARAHAGDLDQLAKRLRARHG
jgi:hypothetical protein